MKKLLLLFLFPFFLFPNIINAQNCSVNAGVDLTVCPNSNNSAPVVSSILLDGNESATNVKPGTRLWQLVSEPAGAAIVIDSPTALQSTTSGTIIPGDYTFSLQVECTDNVLATDQVTFTVEVEPTDAVVLTSNMGCYTDTPLQIDVSAPAAGETVQFFDQGGIPGTTAQFDADTWTFIPEPLTNDCLGNNGYFTEFKYRITTPEGCFKEVFHTITFNYGPGAVYANAIPELACSTTELSAACSLDGTGEWTFTGPGVVAFSPNANDPEAFASASIPGDYTLIWTVTGGCRAGTDQVDVTFVDCSGTCPDDILADAGESIEYCGDFPSSFYLNGSAPGSGQTGTWTQINGDPVTITDINDPNTTITGVSAGDGTHEFLWLVYGGGCLSRDTVRFTEIPLISHTPMTEGSCTDGSGSISNDKVFYKLNNYPFNAFYAQDSLEITVTIFEAPAETINPDGTSTISFDADFYSGGSGWVYNNPGAFNPPITMGVPYTFTIYPEDYLNGDDLNESLLHNQVGNFEIDFSPSPIGFYSVQTTITGLCGTDTYHREWYKGQYNSYTPNAGTDITLDCSVFSTTLAGTGLNINGNHIGQWTMISGPGPSPITTTGQYEETPTITGLVTGTYVFRYFKDIPIQDCELEFDDVILVVPGNNPSANTAVLDQGSVCAGGPATIIGTYDFALGGTWTQDSPAITSEVLTTTGTVGTDTLIVTGLLPNTTYTYSFTTTNSCGSDVNTVTFTTGSDPGPSLADIGEELVCNDANATYALSAAAITNGTGTWTVESQPAGANAGFTNANSPTSTVNNMTEDGVYVLKWSVANPPCPTVSEDLITVVVGTAEVPDAGGDINFCDVTMPYTDNLGAIALTAPSTGAWVFISGPDLPIFGDVNSPTSSITLNTDGTYILGWESSLGGCGVQTDYIQIDVGDGAPVADAGPDQTGCNGTGEFTMDALDLPAGDNGTWVLSSFTGSIGATITTPTDPNTTVTLSGAGDAIFTWVTQSTTTFCPANSDEMVISYFSALAGMNGEDLDLCGVDATTLVGNDISTIAGATSTWSLISGPNTPSIVSPNTATTAITGLVAGTYIFEYSVDNGAGCTDTDQMTVTIADPITIDAGMDQVFCGSETITLTGNDVGAGYDYEWIVTSGTNSGTFSAATSPTTTYGPLTPDVTYTFMYKITNGACQSFDFIQITLLSSGAINFIPTPATCGNSDGAVDLVLTGANGGQSFAWSTGATTEDISSLAEGTYTVTVTDNGGCTAIDSVQIINSNAPEITFSLPGGVCPDTDLTITATATGGLGAPYTYTWDNGTTGPSLVVSPTTPTTYSVTVLDVSGCTSVAEVTVDNFSACLHLI